MFSRSDIVRALKKRLDSDPAKIPPGELTISRRGRKIALLSRQLCSMVTGGVGLIRSLDVLAEQNEDPTLGYVLSDLSGKLGQGYSLSKATSLYTKIFPPVFFHLVAVGENTGQLVGVIERLADVLESEDSLVQKVKGALSYPIFVMVLTFFLTLGLFSTVLPSFADFYKDFDVPLPAITNLLMGITELVRNPWTWVIAGPCAYGTYWLLKTSWADPDRRLYMYRFVTTIPLVGPIVEYSSLARYCWVLELTQDAGLDLMRSIRLGGLASGSAILAMDTARVVRGVTDGEQLSQLMQLHEDYYPSLLSQMVLMGEETSRFSDAFGRSATWFQAEVEGRIETFQAALEPILMGVIATIVGGIVVAVFLPLYGLLDKLGV